MVHIGCGADIIRQRRRNQQLQREAEAQGISVGVKDFKPAKNHKYPHYTPARDKVLNKILYIKDYKLFVYKSIFDNRMSSSCCLTKKLKSHQLLIYNLAGTSQPFL
jgi:hypothetical protein